MIILLTVLLGMILVTTVISIEVLAHDRISFVFYGAMFSLNVGLVILGIEMYEIYGR